MQSIPPRLFPKIPAKLLRDSSPYGALYSIAIKCYEITKQRSLKKIDFANPAKRKEAMLLRPLSVNYMPVPGELSLQRACLMRTGLLSLNAIAAVMGCHMSGHVPKGFASD